MSEVLIPLNAIEVALEGTTPQSFYYVTISGPEGKPHRVTILSSPSEQIRLITSGRYSELFFFPKNPHPEFPPPAVRIIKEGGGISFSAGISQAPPSLTLTNNPPRLQIPGGGVINSQILDGYEYRPHGGQAYWLSKGPNFQRLGERVVRFNPVLANKGKVTLFSIVEGLSIIAEIKDPKLFDYLIKTLKKFTPEVLINIIQSNPSLARGLNSLVEQALGINTQYLLFEMILPSLSDLDYLYKLITTDPNPILETRSMLREYNPKVRWATPAEEKEIKEALSAP